MSESKPDPSSDKGAKAPNVWGRAKEEIEALLHHEKHPTHQEKHPTHHEKHPTHDKETHGMSDDIDENTPVSDVKGPNVFERVKEEFEALVETIHPPKGHKDHDSPPDDERNDATTTGSKHEKQSSHAASRTSSREYVQETWEKSLQTIKSHVKKDHPSVPPKVKQETAEEKTEKSPHVHDKETHGKAEDIDANIPINEFKGPSIFDRAKEEIEAIVDTIHPKKESEHVDSSPKKTTTPKKEGGFRATIGKQLQKIYSPRKHDRD